MTTPPAAPATTYWEEADSPLGTFLLAGDGRTVIATRLPGTWAKEDVPAHWVHAPGSMAPAAAELDGYFDGTTTSFDLEFVPHGTTFQTSVWRALEEIPYAQTASYRDVASATGWRERVGYVVRGPGWAKEHRAALEGDVVRLTSRLEGYATVA